MTLGGVGRNLAAAIELLGHEPTFITSLASDHLGQFARAHLGRLGFAPSRLQILQASGQESRSSCFALVLIDSLSGQCEYVIANLEATRAISRHNLERLADNVEANGRSLREQLKRAPLVVLDANLDGQTVSYLVKACEENGVPIFLEPTDVVCLSRLVSCLKTISNEDPHSLKSLAFLSPNIVELEELTRLFGDQVDAPTRAPTSRPFGESRPLAQVERMAERLMRVHMPHLRCLLVTMDKRGVLVLSRGEQEAGLASIKRTQKLPDCLSAKIACKHYLPEKVIERPISASGAGDCFAAGFISGLIDGLSLSECVQFGFRASACALESESTVPLSLKNLVAADA